MTQPITADIARRALRIIYGGASVDAVDLSLLAALDQRELSTRFRARALELHPDRASLLGREPDDLNSAFRRLHSAYRVLGAVVDNPTLKATLASHAQRASRTASNVGFWTPPTDIRGGSATGSGSAAAADERRYYSGRVPETPLRFAQFLYYHRVIDWKTMIDAVTWQYRVRPKVGEIGRSYRFLDFPSIGAVLRESPRGELFGTTALKMGLLDRRQLSVMLGKQYLLNYPIGRYFVEHGILSKPEVDHLLNESRRHNRAYRTQGTTVR
ncbi:MAG: J domain-containing protein [Spirochaetaceae bacterium]|nr:MAG: J domain-containing protein [Spirochaetaceae bacterium]